MSKILIIDDDCQLLQLLEIAFTKSGHAVSVAENGRIALDIISEQAFDVVISDIIMPESDGIEVLTAIAAMDRRPIFIAMSGGSQRIDFSVVLSIVKAMKADLIMSKPFTPKQLLQEVEALLAHVSPPSASVT